MAPKPGPRPDAEEVIALMRQAPARGRGRRSPIMVWMQENRVALETAFAQTAPAWSVLASYLGERGVTDGDGKPPTARSAREAWGRVTAAAKAADDHATREAAGPAEAGQATAPASGGEEPEPPRRTFGPATPRGMDPAVKRPATPPAAAGTPTPAAPAVDVDDVLARFSGKPGSASR